MEERHHNVHRLREVDATIRSTGFTPPEPPDFYLQPGQELTEVIKRRPA